MSYVGSNPGATWDVWSVDSSTHQGSEASLYLFDGREDDSGWVGVAQPAQIADPHFSKKWLAAIRSERTDSAHGGLAGFAITFFGAALGFAVYRKKSVRKTAIV